MANKTQHNKKALLEALESTLGVVTSACKMVGVNRSTYYDYYNNDPEFKKSVEELSNVALDFVETNLFQNIKKLDTASIIFYLKTKGKNRGYFERQEIDFTDKQKTIADLFPKIDGQED